MRLQQRECQGGPCYAPRLVQSNCKRLRAALRVAGVWAAFLGASAGAQEPGGSVAERDEGTSGLDAGAGAPSEGPEREGSTSPSDEPVAAADGGSAAPALSPDAGSRAQLVPPRVLASPPPVYPSAHLQHAEHPTVVLKVTVLSDGSVADITVEHTAGEDFDQAAVEAVRNWKFEPARMDDQPIGSRVGVAVHFELPELAVMDVASVSSAELMVPHPHDEAPPSHEPRTAAYQATAEVAPELRDQQRSSSDYQLDQGLLSAVPRADVGDLLEVAPGMVATRIEGDAVGHRLLLRGFDADHGQDIELSVDGVPINQPSHLHGQGYADLGFLIPELVQELRVTEGVYDPAQGDFAVAGSADFRLGSEARGVRVVSSYGAFDTFRELAIWAPEGEPDATFAAVQIRKTQGFGQNRGGLSGAALAQGSFGDRKLRLTLHGSAYASRASTPNVVRRDDIEDGRVGFYGVYPYATTEGQGGAAARAQLSAAVRQLGASGQNSELRLFYVLSDFRLLANYTGFVEESRIEPLWVGRGDLIEQQNLTHTLGARARYRSRRVTPWSWASGSLELGLSARVDRVAQTQNLLEAPANTVWDRRVDADIKAIDIGGYLDLDAAFTRYAVLRGGVRADVLTYGVDDRLQNFASPFRAEAYLPGYRRTAAGIVAGPRWALDVSPNELLTLSLAYGEGFRSPQARTLGEGEPAPFTKVRSFDLGARLRLGPGDAWTLRGTTFLTDVEQDIAFDAREGRAEPLGPSRRLGAVLVADLRPWSWLRVMGSATYVQATLTEPPAPTREEPNPPFSKGQRLPYVPPWVVRLDAQAEHALWSIGEHAMVGNASGGFTFWSARPLPYGEHTPSVSLLDLALGVAYRAVRLDASVLNALDLRYAAMELVAPSSFAPDEVPSRVPARHVMAGAPRTWLLSLGVSL